MGTEFYQVSGDAQRALEEFAQDFVGAMSQSGVEQWAKENGLYKASRALKTTYPIPVSSAGYSELKGDLKYRSLFERSISLMPKTWQDGIEELASVVEAPDFTGWAAEPAAMAAAAASLGNRIIATALEANATHPLDALTFFHASHPYNVFDSAVGTFDNDITGAGTTPTASNIKLAAETFRSIKSPKGEPGGYRLTHILAPSKWEEELRDILEQGLLIVDGATASTFGAVDNRQRGRAKLIISDELSGNFWYPLALGKPGAFPWIVQDEGAPEQILNDKSSDHYKRTLKVSLAYVLRANGGLALPHCVQRWEGTA
jgi:phage major head subunit gpT-like protein